MCFDISVLLVHVIRDDGVGLRHSLVTSPEQVGARLKLAIVMENAICHWERKKEIGRSRVERWRCCGHLGSLTRAITHSLRMPQIPSTKAPFLIRF